MTDPSTIYPLDKVIAFIKANTDAYYASAQCRIAGGMDTSGFVDNILCFGDEGLIWSQFRNIMQGLIYEFFACDMGWYQIGCTGDNDKAHRKTKLSTPCTG